MAPYVKQTGNKVWRKVLYKKQDFPDNYIDESTFLNGLQTNKNNKTFSLGQALKGATVVSEEIGSVAIFASTFAYMDIGTVLPTSLLIGSSIMAFIVYVYYCLTDETRSSHPLQWCDLRLVTIFTLLGFGLSPILKTLTNTISTDSIYCMATFMLLAHLIFHDYGASAAIVSSSLSFNAAIFASVCLASRLPTIWHAFSFMTFSVEIFALFPLFRKYIKKISPHLQMPLAMATVGVAVCMVFSLSVEYAIFLVMTIFFVNVVCPCWFVQWQGLKNTLTGPWDEAVINDGDSLKLQ